MKHPFYKLSCEDWTKLIRKLFLYWINFFLIAVFAADNSSYSAVFFIKETTATLFAALILLLIDKENGQHSNNFGYRFLKNNFRALTCKDWVMLTIKFLVYWGIFFILFVFAASTRSYSAVFFLKEIIGSLLAVFIIIIFRD
jgi:hypothetical protein